MDNDVKQKIDFVDQYIGGLARKLANNDKGLEEKLTTEIKEIILQNDLKSSSEEASSLLKILSKENSEVDTKTLVEAKGASMELSRWAGENMDSIQTYRGEDLATNLIKETIKDNPNIKEEDIKRIVRSLVDNVNKIYNSDASIEDQKDAVLKEFEKESPGKIKNALNDTQGVTGMARLKPKQYKKVIDNHEKITAEVQKHNIKIPYNRFDKVASYDRVMNLIKNPEMRKFIESARSKFKTLERISKGRFSQFTNNLVSRIRGDGLRNIANNFFNKSIVTTSGGFASQIGAQTAKDFVQNSVGSILNSGGFGGLKSVMQGVMNKGTQLASKAAMNVAAKLGLKSAAMNVAAKLGLKSAAMALKTALGAALGAATAGLGTIAMAGFQALGKFFEALGMKLTNSKMVDTAIILLLVIVVLIFGMGTAVADDVSSLVPEVETEGEGVGGPFNHGEITMTEDGRIRDCGVGMEVNFNRKNNTPLVTPNVLSTALHNKQLEEYVGDNFGTPCGVVYAAHYLAYDFEYWVPYWLTGKWAAKGLNPQWGKRVVSDWNGHREGPLGLDCGAFRNWAWVNGGYSAWMSNIRPNIPFGNCELIKAAIEPGDGLYMDNPPEINGKKTYSHSAIVLAYDDRYIKFAHAGGSSGVTTGLINICTGVGLDNGNHFDFLQKKAY